MSRVTARTDRFHELACRSRAPEIRIQQRESKRDCIPWSWSIVRDVPGWFDEAVHILWANFEDPANSGIDRQELLARLPVENHLRLRPDEPAMAKLVSKERLKKQRVRSRASGISREGNWILR